MKSRYTRTDTLYLLAMLALILAFLAPAWRQPNSIWITPDAVYSDLLLNQWQNWQLIKQSLRQHSQVPLWRPTIMAGSPFVGNPQANLFYPPNWLVSVLPLPLAFHVLLALHLYGAGLALYRLARRAATSTPFAAFVAGTSYALTPKIIAHAGAGHVGFWQAFAWLPVSLLLLHNATDASLAQIERETARRRSIRSAIACGASLALTYLANPSIAFLGALAVAVYALYRWIEHWQGNGALAALHLALRLTLVPLSTIAFSAVQVLPTLELMRALTRATLDLAEAGFRSLPWRYTIGYLLADWGGYHEWMTYLGLVPVGLALLALVKSRARARWFWLVLSALSLLYALGINTPFYRMLYRLWPALGWVRVPSRALLLVALSSSVLAAHGTDALLAGDRTPRERYLANLLSAGGFLACAGLGLGFAWIRAGDVPPAVILLSSVGLAASLVGFLSLQPRVPQPLVQVLLAGTLLVELGAVGHSLLDLRGAERVEQEGLAAATWAATQRAPFDGPYRVFSPSLSIPQHTGARLGLEQVDGVDPIQLHRTAHYVGLASDCPATGYGVTLPHIGQGTDPSTACRGAVPNARMLGLLNTCFVVAEYPVEAPGLAFEGQSAGTYRYRNEQCLPRAFTMTRVERVQSWQEAQARLADGHDPAQYALVEDDRTLDGPTGWQPAQLQDRSPNHLTVYAETTQPALLVLSEIWYPGWQAAVDGIEQPIVRVNGLLRGVYLAPGTHTVVWRYRPASLRWGAAITLCALAGWLLFLLWTRRRGGEAP